MLLCMSNDISFRTLAQQAIRKRLEQRQMMKRRSQLQKQQQQQQQQQQKQQQQQQQNHDQHFDSKDIPRAALADGPETAKPKPMPTEDAAHQRAGLEDVDSTRSEPHAGSELNESSAHSGAAADGLRLCLECVCRECQLLRLYIHCGTQEMSRQMRAPPVTSPKSPNIRRTKRLGTKRNPRSLHR